MNLTKGLRATSRTAKGWLALVPLMICAVLMAFVVRAQGVSTTTVQGNVYLANGQRGAGTLVVRWPAFTTSAGQAVVAGSLTVKISGDGFVSVSLAPNQGSSPAGQYYTAVFYMSDGTTSTEYWVVPAMATATLGQVRAQVMPAAQALQAVNKAYVDQSISQLSQSLLAASGGSVGGPLYLSGDPTQALQAADKHYVDAQVASAVPIAGGAMTGALYLNGDPTQDAQAADKHYVDAAAAGSWPGMVLRVDQFAGADFGEKLQACLNAVNASYGGTCDGRNFSGNVAMKSDVTIAKSNTTVLLPCATVTTTNRVVITGGNRNVSLRGCAQRGGSAGSGSTGGTAFAYSGTGAMIQVGDTGYAVDTPGFHMDNAVINTTAATNASAQAIAALRTQELDLESLYLLGNSNQTGMTLDGTGNYPGGTILDVQIGGFKTAVNAIGHQVANDATTDWVNASTFVRLHINCPTSGGSPIAGTYGINLQQGDGNTFTGGDIEGCATAFHFGPNAQNNTIVGLRNENSTKQVVADAGSSYNNWITGGTMFTGQLTDNGTRNSFLDTFHRSFNGLNGDWYGSQQDATLTNHYRLGIGAGNERGLQDRYQTDGGYRWTLGLSDATGGEQYYQVLDELNNVNRFSIGQYNVGQASTNNQTVINAAGTGAVVLNGSNGAGTGGVVFGSGGSNSATVASIGSTGNAQFNGALQVGGTSQSAGTMTVRNNADAEVDYYLWPGLTNSQKGSFTYKDWNGNSQWFLLKDASNNWAVNSAIGGLDSFKAYQSTNSGDTYVNASNSTGVVRVNYESGAGAGFKVYGGNSSTLYASFTGTSSIAFPGLAASSGRNCLQIDSSGYISNTGAACGSGSAGSGTINSGNSGQIAYYTSNGTAISGMSAVPVTAGGTGASSAAAALASLGGLPSTGGALSGALSGTDANFSGSVSGNAASFSQLNATAVKGNVNGVFSVTTYGAVGDCTGGESTATCTDNRAAIQAAIDAAYTTGGAVYFPTRTNAATQTVYYTSAAINPKGVSMYGPPGAGGPTNYFPSAQPVAVRGGAGKDVFDVISAGSSGYVVPLTSFTVRDLAIIVDDSTDASASFTTRRPGRRVVDAVMTSSSAVLTSATAQFQPGDVGQNVTVNGAGAAGVTLSTTIASWQSETQVTLSNPASTNVTNAALYISVMSLSTTQNIGNCAFAYDDADGLATVGPLRPLFDNVVINTTSAAGLNNSCGYFFQGNQDPTWGHWVHGAIKAAWGFAFVPAANATPFVHLWTGMGDSNNIGQMLIASTYPWLSYGGGHNSLRDVQIGLVAFGPQILGAFGEYKYPLDWSIDLPEIESPNPYTCAAPRTVLRLSGWSHLIDRISFPTCTPLSNNVLQWDASRSMALNMVSSSPAAFNITGTMNNIDISDNFVNRTQIITDTGSGNIITERRLAEPANSIPSTRRSYAGGDNAGFGPSSIARGAIAFERAHDFIDKGAAAYYFNSEDLWIWPSEAGDYIQGHGPVPTVADPLSEAGGKAIYNASAAAVIAVSQSNGHQFQLGYQFPAGKARVYFKSRSASSSSFLMRAYALESGVWTSLTSSCNPVTLGTSYTINYCDYDATGLDGDQLYFNLWVISGGDVYTAWMGVRPWVNDEPVNSLQIGTGGTPVTGNHGNAVKLQHSDGTGTSGDLARFDVNGNVVDGPTPPAGAMVGTTDVQTLTNKSIAGSEINSGAVATSFGGTGIDSHTATGIAQVSAGTWSVGTALPSGTMAATTSANDNSTKVATTAYVASPGAIMPTTVAASGIISGGNDTTRTTSTTVGNSWATTGLVLPTVPISTVKSGRCVIYWQMSSASYTATFGLGMNNAPTNVWGGTSVTYNAAGATNWLAFTQSSTSTVAISTAATPGATGTTYRAEIDFAIQTGSSNPVAMTVYGQTSNGSATLSIMPGSTCYWLP